MRISLSLLLLIPLTVVAQQSNVEEIDRIVALVNDDVIVKTELDQRMRTVVAQLMQNRTQAPPTDVLEKQVLERLVLSRLQLQLAERTGVRVDDKLLNGAMRQIAQQNKLTLSEFRTILQAEGYDFASFREEIRAELTITRLQERQVNQRIQVTDREVNDFLATAAQQRTPDDEFRLGHIIIALPAAPAPEDIAAARLRAEEVAQELRQGADFAQMAVAVSDGQQGLEGGDLGWRKMNQLPTLFADLVVGMRAGDISDPIRSPSGFHIIKLLEVQRGQVRMVTQTHARHVLIRPDEITSEQDARIRLQQLKERIQNGEDFGELARSHSDDGGSAVKGGDLGWVSGADLVPQFRAAMDKLQPNEISDPFQSTFGWHIAQVLDRRQYDGTEEIRRTQAKNLIRERKIEDEVQAWVRRLRDEAYVEYRLDQ